MNILFYGNCQIEAIKTVLNLDTNLFPVQVVIPCFKTEVTELQMQQCIQTSDVIIMNPIQNNYRNKNYLSSEYVIYHSKPSCKIIFINNCHFDFYYFDSKIVHDNYKITPYHQLYLYGCYKENRNINYYLTNIVNNKELQNKEKLESFANASLDELLCRYNLMLLYKKANPNKDIQFISVYDFIKDNYKYKLLFYTVNHPSKFLIQYICENILNILRAPNTIRYELDMFDHTRCFLYKCIQNVVFFDVTQHTPLIDGKQNPIEICKMYHKMYSEDNLILE